MAVNGNDSKNILVMNAGNTPGIGYSFIMRVEGIYDVPCRKIRAFTRGNEYDYIQEGGVNDYVHMRRKPISQPFSFQVERYMGIDYLDPLPSGADLILPIIIFVGATYDHLVRDAKRTLIFFGCSVMSKEYGEMAAETSGLVCDVVTIAYREMVSFEGLISLNLFDGLSNMTSRNSKEMSDDEKASYESWKTESSNYSADKLKEKADEVKNKEEAAKAAEKAEKERRKELGVPENASAEELRKADEEDKKKKQEEAKKEEEAKKQEEAEKAEEARQEEEARRAKGKVETKEEKEKREKAQKEEEAHRAGKKDDDKEKSRNEK